MRPLKLVWKEGPKTAVEGGVKVEEEANCRLDSTVVEEEDQSSYSMFLEYVGNHSEFAQWSQEYSHSREIRRL